MVNMFQKIDWKRAIKFLLTRTALLFLVALLSWQVLVRSTVLKAKAINQMLPQIPDIEMFADHPAQMGREKLVELAGYYKMVQTLLAADPEAPAPCGAAAYAYYYLGRPATAIAYYKKAIDQNPYFFWFYYDLGLIYYHQKNYTLAAEAFLNAVQVPEERSLMFMRLTKVYKDIQLALKIG
ncbi:MAG: tetratricopeptide repeat protein, partial [Candidatus Omnitrophica bacterium]|nr:tetratricopeptide repeat protein [Candidatus Omnitrophota bacterium]